MDTSMVLADIITDRLTGRGSGPFHICFRMAPPE
jgi:hypothetical protein